MKAGSANKRLSKSVAPSKLKSLGAKIVHGNDNAPKEERKEPFKPKRVDCGLNGVRRFLKPADKQIWHGSLGNPEWAKPKVTLMCEEPARKGRGYKSMSKSEYKDKPEVL